MDEYYQNGPLPTWIGWYVQHFPHWFHAATAFGTLALELVLVWMLFLPRRWRIVCFFIVTPWQIGIILTANYTFLNYLVLALGFLLLDDRFFVRFVPHAMAREFRTVADTSARGFVPREPALSEFDSAVDIDNGRDVRSGAQRAGLTRSQLRLGNLGRSRAPAHSAASGRRDQLTLVRFGNRTTVVGDAVSSFAFAPARSYRL